MTREETIQRLKNMAWLYGSAEREQNIEAIDMAIEALQAEPTKAVPLSLADVYKWERDVALSQLEEYGIGFAEKKRDDLLEVVRCKDCKYLNRKEAYGDEWKECTHYPQHHIRLDDYCSYGERREP